MHTCRVIQCFRLPLFDAICKERGTRDESLQVYLTSGLPLVQRGADPPESPGQYRPATHTVPQERRASRWTRSASEAKSRPPGDESLAGKVWVETSEELSLGWLAGPHPQEGPLVRLGPSLVSRRFGIPPGG